MRDKKLQRLQGHFVKQLKPSSQVNPLTYLMRVEAKTVRLLKEDFTKEKVQYQRGTVTTSLGM